MRMKKKELRGKKGEDPEWIQDISCCFFTYRIKGKTDRYNKKLRELFLEYMGEGMKPKGSVKKAKLILDYFEIE